MWNMLDTHQLMRLIQHTEAPSNFWLDRYFGGVQTFDTEYIDFEKVAKGRKLAPFVSPMAKGKVLADRGSEMIRFKPAYVKPKHALDPGKVIKRRPGEAIGGSSTPQARADAILMDYMQDHRDIIERRWEWLAAKAILDGKVTITGDDYPEQVVDFKRDANNTVTKTSGSYWGETGVSIVQDLNGWITSMRRRPHSGPVNDLIVTPSVYDVMIADAKVKDLLDTNYRGSDADINRGVQDGSSVQFMGRLNNLNVILYQDWYEDESGTVQEFMADGEICLAGPNVQGVRAFGAIMDSKAGYRSMEIFQKMFEEDDPSATFLLSQSAPLMIPVNPNNTFKAKVIA